MSGKNGGNSKTKSNSVSTKKSSNTKRKQVKIDLVYAIAYARIARENGRPWSAITSFLLGLDSDLDISLVKTALGNKNKAPSSTGKKRDHSVSAGAKQ